MANRKDENIDELLSEVNSLLSDSVTGDGRPRRAAQAPTGGRAQSGQAVPGSQPQARQPARYQPEELPDRTEPPRKKKKRHGFLKFLLVLVIIVGLLAAGVAVAAKQPKSPDNSANRALTCTILLAGSDEGGLRTDTMMLVTVDAAKGKLYMLSVPRDTLTWGTWNVPKLNSAYGVYDGGDSGMGGVIMHMTEVIGFKPDGYATVSLDAFIKAVDMLGGVDFDVPQDMYYWDPTQNLMIDLKAGMQHLDGQQCMGLVRYRSGYARADLQRVEVQRAFISACIDQWLTPANIAKIPQLMKLIKGDLVTDLDTREMIWLAAALLRCGTSDAETATLPGYGATISGGSYYIIDGGKALELLNSGYSPLKRPLTSEDLNIRTG